MIKIVNNEQQANCITHSGTMHADEVFSTAFLEMYLKDVRIYRTNYIDNSKVQENTIIYDVGRGKYDHHQPEAAKRENDITYCSFGLLWKEYGKEFLKNYDIKYVDEVWNGIDKDLVEYIDADDNGLLEDERKNNNKNEVEQEKEKENEVYDEPEEPKGKALKPKKILSKNRENEEKKERKYNRPQREDVKDEGEDELPPGVASINKTEKVIMENGCKKRITKIIKVMEDGSKQVETTKEVIDE